MTAEERRELEALVEQWKHAADMSPNVPTGAAAHRRCARDLRATLDRLTDQQSGEECQHPEAVDITTHADRPATRLLCIHCGHEWLTEPDEPPTDEEVMPDDGVGPERSEPNVSQGERLEESLTEIRRRLGDLEAKLGRMGLRREQWQRIQAVEGRVEKLESDHLHRSPDSQEGEDR